MFFFFFSFDTIFFADKPPQTDEEKQKERQTKETREKEQQKHLEIDAAITKVSFLQGHFLVDIIIFNFVILKRKLKVKLAETIVLC